MTITRHDTRLHSNNIILSLALLFSLDVFVIISMRIIQVWVIVALSEIKIPESHERTVVEPVISFRTSNYIIASSQE